MTESISRGARLYRSKGHGQSRGVKSAVRTLTCLVVIASLLAACTSSDEPRPDQRQTASSTYPRPERYETGPNSEVIKALPVPTTATSGSKRVVYSQQLTLSEGQVLLASAEFQVTNDLGYNVFVASQLILADDPSTTTGRPITAANGRNVTPDMHHDQQTKVGTHEVTKSDSGSRYVNLVVWSAASRALAADLLNVNPGYGDLSVLVW